MSQKSCGWGKLWGSMGGSMPADLAQVVEAWKKLPKATK